MKIRIFCYSNFDLGFVHNFESTASNKWIQLLSMLTSWRHLWLTFIWLHYKMNCLESYMCTESKKWKKYHMDLNYSRSKIWIMFPKVKKNYGESSFTWKKTAVIFLAILHAIYQRLWIEKEMDCKTATDLLGLVDNEKKLEGSEAHTRWPIQTWLRSLNLQSNI